VESSRYECAACSATSRWQQLGSVLRVRHQSVEVHHVGLSEQAAYLVAEPGCPRPAVLLGLVQRLAGPFPAAAQRLQPGLLHQGVQLSRRVVGEQGLPVARARPQAVELPVHVPHELKEVRVPLGWRGPPARPRVHGPLTVLVHVLGIHEDVGDVGLDVELQPAPPDVRLPPLLGSGVLVQVLLEHVREPRLVVVPVRVLGPRQQPHEPARVPPPVADLEELPVRRGHPSAEALLHNCDPLLGHGWEPQPPRLPRGLVVLVLRLTAREGICFVCWWYRRHASLTCVKRSQVWLVGAVGPGMVRILSSARRAWPSVDAAPLGSWTAPSGCVGPPSATARWAGAGSGVRAG